MMPRSLAALAALSLAALAGCPADPASPTTSGTTTTAGSGGSGGGGAGGSGGSGGGGVACPVPGIGKGPWSLAVTQTTAKVRWEACVEGTSHDLTLTPEAGGAPRTITASVTPITLTESHPAPLAPMAPVDAAGTYYTFEAAVDALSPSTCYAYELAQSPEKKGRFCTARVPGDDFRFMAIADTNPGLGNYTVDTLSKVLPENPDFVLHGGDVQYYASGLETWASWFPLMQPMLSQGAFYPAVGNHEAEVPDELDGYFRRFFGGAGFAGVDDYYRFESGGVWFFALNTELDEETGPQAAWLEAELAAASVSQGYRFSVVYFHKPWVTCGDKSQDSAARAHFEPIFAQYGVPLVVQGHMHGYERFDINGITYVTTGGGGGALEDVDANIDRPECAMRVASGAFRHAMIFDVTAGALMGRAIDDTGTVRDSWSLIVP
jgi:hypothetical protein